jgi:hypothetical protein
VLGVSARGMGQEMELLEIVFQKLRNELDVQRRQPPPTVPEAIDHALAQTIKWLKEQREEFYK